MGVLMENSLMLTKELADVKVETVGIFPRGHVTIVAGEPGIGKTWFMLSIAKSVASGSQGMGDYINHYPKGKSLIFAGETGVRLLANRVQLMGGIEPIESCRVVSSHLCAKLSIDTMVNTAIGRKNIRDAVMDFNPDITFFDTMISFMSDGKDESSQVDMTDAIRGLGAVASETNTAMVLLHHFRKRSTTQSVQPSTRTMDEVIGSSAFIRLASLVIGIERKREIRMVRCLKSWWEEFNPFAFTISKTKEGIIYLKQDYNYDKDGGYSSSRSISRVATAILSRMHGREFDTYAVVGEFDISTSSAREAINTLLARRLIEATTKEGNTQRYRVKEVKTDAYGTADVRAVADTCSD